MGEWTLSAITILTAKDKEKEMITITTFKEIFSRNVILQQQQIFSLQVWCEFL